MGFLQIQSHTVVKVGTNCSADDWFICQISSAVIMAFTTDHCISEIKKEIKEIIKEINCNIASKLAEHE